MDLVERKKSMVKTFVASNKCLFDVYVVISPVNYVDKLLHNIEKRKKVHSSLKIYCPLNNVGMHALKVKQERRLSKIILWGFSLPIDVLLVLPTLTV